MIEISSDSSDDRRPDTETTDKDLTYDSDFATSKGNYVPVCKNHTPNVYSPVPVIGCVLGLANVTKWGEIESKIRGRKSKTCADKAKGKRKVSW